MKLSPAAREKIVVFRAARYRIDTDIASIEFRLDEPNRRTDQLLTQYKTQCATFISACNPGARLLPEEMNEYLHKTLIRTLANAGFKTVPGVASSTDKVQWIEPSLLVPGMDVFEANRLASLFGQLAWVRLARFKPARLKPGRLMFRL